MPPDSHAFCLLDISLSYPHHDQPKVPLWLLIILAVILPVVCIVVCTLFAQQSPIPADRATGPTRYGIDRIRELNAALLGLGVSLATSTIIYTGVKNLSGKPRPDFLSICQPDLEKVDAYTVGGYGREYHRLWVMVDRGICQQPDQTWLNDALRSFPSGYATSKNFLKHTKVITNSNHSCICRPMVSLSLVLFEVWSDLTSLAFYLLAERSRERRQHVLAGPRVHIGVDHNETSSALTPLSIPPLCTTWPGDFHCWNKVL